ncbi:MAG: hypothetical protein M1829_002533 [Trizodia sp. TS-e1964]|nr:MAG: hypothetical protein M1829_002533 [Trizodia sp. TS-e1964]
MANFQKKEALAGKWNTSNLPLRLASDTLTAICAGGIIAPIIATIDKGIIENASGRAPIIPSITSSLRTLILRPHHFLLSRPFGLVFFLYTSTYLTANALDTLRSTTASLPSPTVSSGPAKFLATSATNMGLGLYKDSQFTRLFGPPAALPARIPLPSLLLFGVRDALTIFASFNAPPLLAPLLPRLSSGEQLVAAQFLAPVAMQVASTPLHLLGLDLYNRRAVSGVVWRVRAAKVVRDWAGSCAARMGRIGFAFGVGGVVNTRVRRRLMEWVEAR